MSGLVCLLCGAIIGYPLKTTSWGGARDAAYKAHVKRCVQASPAERAHYYRHRKWPKRS